MAKPQDLQKTITRRTLLVGSVMGLAGGALLARVGYLQFVRGEELNTLAEGNRIKLQLIAPPRGLITDANGVLLASNEVSYRLFLERDNPKQAQDTLKTLAKLLDWDAAKTAQMQAEVGTRPRGPLLVSEHVRWEQLTRIEYYLPELPGIRLEEGQVRSYPFADRASHLIGHVGRVDQNEASAKDPLSRLPEFKIGKNGVEFLFDETLRGKAGSKQLEVNATGLPVRELERTEPTRGDTLQLTVDSRLQEFIVDELVGQSGGVVVMNVHNGEVLALVSVPGFDPNIFSTSIPTAYWKALNADEKNPLHNKAIAGLYPPGSTFKMLVGLAALEAEKATAETKVYCPGHYYLGNHRFNCWKPEGHGHMDLKMAIAQSCDTYFYTMGRAVGIEAIADISHKMGLGALSGIGLRGERAGIVPSPEWKKAAGRGPWNPGETINTSIGQGDVLASPLQMAIMTARLVNGGKLVTPRLTKAPAGIDFPSAGFTPEHLAQVVEGIDWVVNNPRGTAYGARIMEGDKLYAGKTGTAQVRRITVRGQDQSKIPWKFRHHAWFVAYGPTVNPQFAACVLIEHGGGGASVAAPVARNIMQKTMELYA